MHGRTIDSAAEVGCKCKKIRTRGLPRNDITAAPTYFCESVCKAAHNPLTLRCLQVSAGAAYYSTGVFISACFWKLVAGATLVIAWLNLR